MKHRLKMVARELWARLLYHTGLFRLVGRLVPRRLTILTSHCVTAPSNDFLPPDMKIDGEHLAGLLRRLGRHFDWVTVGEGWRRLQAGEGRSMLALTMDDGYRDNLEHLLPILQREGATATVYLESRPLDGRSVNWTHVYFWLLARLEHAELVRRYAARSEDARAVARLEEELGAGGDLTYRLKKVLKYEADQADCERTLLVLLEEEGGDAAELCRGLYLSWEDARRLRAAGLELGGHTVHHYVLSGLDAAGQEREVAEGKRALEQRLGPVVSFAYPFGRRWDWNDASREAVRAAGFATATTTHAGTNTRASDPTRLARWMIDERTPEHLLVCEASGGFELLRRLGVDLSE